MIISKIRQFFHIYIIIETSKHFCCRRIVSVWVLKNNLGLKLYIQISAFNHLATKSKIIYYYYIYRIFSLLFNNEKMVKFDLQSTKF